MASSTPFVKPFGPLLFGRAARGAIKKLARLDSLHELYELFGHLFPERLLVSAEEGLNSRERLFTPQVTFWAFVAQVLSPGSPCREMVRRIEAWWQGAGGGLAARQGGGAEDRLVRWEKPSQRIEAWSEQEFAALPQTLTLRMIRLRVTAKGFCTRRVVLVTTLTDAELYPADALRKLYGERWQVELHFAQIKTILAMDVLRCKSPEMTERGVAIHRIAYNLVRSLMSDAALRAPAPSATGADQL